MHDKTKNFSSKIILASIILWLIGSVILLISLSIDVSIFSWIIGWTWGYGLCISGFFANILVSKYILSKKRSKQAAFWLFFWKSFIMMIYYFLLVFILILIDFSANNHQLFVNGSVKDLNGPINIFATFLGISIVMITIFIMHLPWFNRKKKYG